MKNIYFVEGWGGGTKDYSPTNLKSVPFKEIEDGPIIGSFLINGELYGLDFLSKDQERPNKTLYAICDEKNIAYGNFSGLIPKKFLTPQFPEDGILPRIISIKPNMLNNEDDLSWYIAVLSEVKESRYWSSFFSEYLVNLGYDVSIEKGFLLFEKYMEKSKRKGK